ncbi:glycine-rich cell wall structural protein isoform X3 [Cyprinus carpio]|uniref:Glycine-rich cell wall structural protein isoform X3 n=1 Tax=Cyprinus carpio TaxID=7962 RepID=A0A9R0AUH3_CYPCA|nr:glycine-rich cell wall structural protein isoform X3 [Cyprinus carpio]
MLVRAILQTSLVLWLVQSTIQGGVRPQTGALGRLASRGPGIGVKSGGPVAGILGVRGYGAGKPGKTGSGRYLGGAAYRPTAIRGGLKQGYGTLGGYGGASNLGTGLGAAGLGLGTGYGLGNGLGAALGYPAGKLGGRGYTSNGYGAQLGYGAGGYPGAGRGYGVPAGTPTGQGSKPSKQGVGPRGGQPVSQGERGDGYSRGWVPNGQDAIANGFPSGPGVTNGMRAQIKGYGPAADMINGRGIINNGPVLPSGQGTKPSNMGYGLGAAGYLGAGYTDGYGAGLGAGGYPQGVRAGKQIAGYSNGYGSEVYGTADGYGAGPAYPSVLADNVGLNGIAGLGAAGLGGPGLVVNPGLGADAKSRKYGAGGVLGAAGSLPYGGQPVVSAGLGPQGKTGSYGGATYGGIPSLGADTSLGGAVGQIPYSAPVIAAGLDVDAGYPFGAEQVSLGADATKTAAKYGTGYAAALSTGGQGPYGGQKDGSKLSGMYGNGYKG